MWKCGICLIIITLTLRQMLTHIREKHSKHEDFSVFCGIDGCQNRLAHFT